MCDAVPDIQCKQSTSCCSTFVPGFPDSKGSEMWPKMNHCYKNDKRRWGKNHVISFGKKRVLFLVIFSLIFLFHSTSVYSTEYNTSCCDCSLCDCNISRRSAAKCLGYRVQRACAAGSSKKPPHNPLPPTYPPKKPKPGQNKQKNLKCCCSSHVKNYYIFWNVAFVSILLGFFFFKWGTSSMENQICSRIEGIDFDC